MIENYTIDFMLFFFYETRREREGEREKTFYLMVRNIDKNVAFSWILFDTKHALLSIRTCGSELATNEKHIHISTSTSTKMYWRSRSSNALTLFPMMPHSSIYQFWNPNTINHKTNKWNKCAAILQCTFPSDSVWKYRRDTDGVRVWERECER